MRFQWSAELETGVRQIDLQHQELFEIGNQLVQAIEDDELARAMDEVLPRLRAYVLFHFGTEEALFTNKLAFAAHGAMHTKEHQEFSRKVEALRGQPPSRDLLLAFTDDVSAWITDHVARTDKDLVTLLREQSSV